MEYKGHELTSKLGGVKIVLGKQEYIVPSINVAKSFIDKFEKIKQRLDK
jgi:hypothetical protein